MWLNITYERTKYRQAAYNTDLYKRQSEQKTKVASKT